MESYYIKNVLIYMNKSYINPPNLKLTTVYKNKRKKTIKKLIVKDRIIKIPFNINNLYCNVCSSRECYHIDFIYNNLYKIDKNLINLLYCSDFDYSLKDFDIDKFYKFCYNYLENYECCYCLENLNTKYDLWLCDTCKHLVHSKCISKWITKKKECPLCKQSIYKIFGKIIDNI